VTRRSITILGATGSVGRSTLDLVERSPDAFEVVALTAATRVDELADAARRTGARLAVVADESKLPELRERLAGTDVRAGAGESALAEAAAEGGEWVMAAIVGCAGLKPVMAAVEAGRTVALANKEALVTAGALMTNAAAQAGATILPVDSEHNAIFQCLAGSTMGDVARIVLTASGGPFRDKSLAEMERMTPGEAVAHPNWTMGAKISVDSATMMNKGLELIEARHLFGLPGNRIDIVVHPQSVVHSMVEFVDGSVLAQMGSPDMRIPIAHALAHPGRMETPADKLDLIAAGRLDFEAPDEKRFPSLRLAREALEAAGAASIVLNASNEVAVAAFLGGRIGFLDIARLVAKSLESRAGLAAPRSVDEVIDIDRETRQQAEMLIREQVA
jgi:1-deoxy-D-xylulose-5-phosphate reductoisomerase